MNWFERGAEWIEHDDECIEHGDEWMYFGGVEIARDKLVCVGKKWIASS